MKEKEKTQRPNIVFIFADQWRGDCLSADGHPVVETPNLDGLANQSGLRFTRAYSPCPSCIAARASVFTGLTPYSHGRVGYQDDVPWTYDNMLAQVLSDGGYQTHCVGKTHFAPQRNHCGFQSMDSHEERRSARQGYPDDYYDWLAKESGGEYTDDAGHGLDVNSWLARPSHLPEKWHNNTWTVTKSIEFVRRRDRSRPFFLNVAFTRPHPPIDPPQAFYDMYKDKPLPPVPVGEWSADTHHPMTSVNGPHGVLPEGALDHTRRAYYAQIAHLDNQIGRLQRALEIQGVAGNTWFVFASDHGEMLGDHDRFRKMYALEGSARVPMIIAPPSVTLESAEEGGVFSAPVSLEDVYPTILEMAGLEIPENTEGRSLLPFFQGEPKEWREYTHGEHSGWGVGRQFMTDGKEKYIWKTVTGKEYLFDLENDPQELRDLAPLPEHEERLLFWRQRMIEHLAKRDDGMSDGKELIPGKDLPAVRDFLLQR